MKDSTTLKGVINKFDNATTALKEAALIARNTATTNEERQCAEQAIKKANRAQAIINLIQRKEQIKELRRQEKVFLLDAEKGQGSDIRAILHQAANDKSLEALKLEKIFKNPNSKLITSSTEALLKIAANLHNEAAKELQGATKEIPLKQKN